MPTPMHGGGAVSSGTPRIQGVPLSQRGAMRGMMSARSSARSQSMGAQYRVPGMSGRGNQHMGGMYHNAAAQGSKYANLHYGEAGAFTDPQLNTYALQRGSVPDPLYSHVQGGNGAYGGAIAPPNEMAERDAAVASNMQLRAMEAKDAQAAIQSWQREELDANPNMGNGYAPQGERGQALAQYDERAPRAPANVVDYQEANMAEATASGRGALTAENYYGRVDARGVPQYNQAKDIQRWAERNLRGRDHPVGPDVQQLVWPYSLTEGRDNVVFKRTADVKAPLRSMVRTPDKVSTYDHDFTSFKVPVFGNSARSVSGSVDVPPLANGRTAEPDLAQQQNRYRRADLAEGRMNWYQTSGSRTLDSLQMFKERGRPLEATVSGWGATTFEPRKFPEMFRGGTDRQLHINQSVHRLNLRAPSLMYMQR